MGWSRWMVQAVRGRVEAARPRPGRVVEAAAPRRWREYPADGLTPGELSRILRAADEGSAEQALALFEQMEEKDAHLHAVAQIRRLALTGLSWRILSAAEVREGVDPAAAEEAAAYCREVLSDIEGLDAALQHLSLAIGRNIAVAENVWEPTGGELRLVDVVPVPFDRLAFDGRGRLRILTRREPVTGETLPPGKLVVHCPHAVSGHPMRGGLLRATAMAYLGKHYALKDWMVYTEVFGMPVRVARYEPSATPEEKRELLRMVESLGGDAAAIVSKAVELEFIEAGQGKAPPPYEHLCNFFNRELSKAWLGGTLTVEALSGEAGNFATTPQVHNEVRLDIRQDDIAREARTVRRDVLAPLARYRFGPGVPVPFFRRVLEPPRDLRALAAVLDTAVNELRMRVPLAWAHQALGVPEAARGEAVLTGRT